MFSRDVFLIGVSVATAIAAPSDPRHIAHDLARNEQPGITSTYTSTKFGTVTLSLTTTIPTTITPSPVKESPKPVYTATQLYAYREDSPIHLLPIHARGLYFQLGGLPTTACPAMIKHCPPGVITGMDGCELSVIVPGGQQVYLKPDGSLRFTASHSVAMAPGSLQCPLSFTNVGSDVSETFVHGFGATGFMACPMLDGARVPQQWQVYANIANASVPLVNTTSASCLEFKAFGIRYLGDTPAAYGYL